MLSTEEDCYITGEAQATTIAVVPYQVGGEQATLAVWNRCYFLR